jgi:pyruvate/2-oxoglutarate dehydrogenase complex dihydrolipoamide dehydrogenase (E3) component
MKRLSADLVVIGAGAGGLSVASGAAQLGLRVVLFEKGEMGGDCLNTGCVPSKALIAAGGRAHAMRTADVFGVASVAAQVDWPSVKAHIRHVIETIAPIDSQERFEGLGCTVVREHARFTGPRTVESASVSVKARRIVVAAGGRAALPEIPGIETVGALTNETIFDLDVFPERLIILGAGPIGVELGQAFQRLGSQVTLIEPFTPLARFDPELSAIAMAGISADGVVVRTGDKPVAVRTWRRRASGRTLKALKQAKLCARPIPLFGPWAILPDATNSPMPPAGTRAYLCALRCSVRRARSARWRCRRPYIVSLNWPRLA